MSNILPKVLGGCSGCFVLVMLGGIVLIALLYAEEDWRGAHELAETKARWQAAGFSLDPADCVPPLVPDDRNLAALPIFQLEPDPVAKGQVTDLRLKAATDPDKHGGALTDTTKKTDLTTMVAKAYAKVFPGKQPPTSAVAQLEELYPMIVDLRTAAPMRPEFRLNIEYISTSPAGRPIGPVVRQISVAKLLQEHAQLALNEGHPDVALQDIQINFQIARGVVKDPSLVGGLVAIGVTAIARLTLDDALTKHEWNDAQLAQLQEMLKRPDFLAEYQFVMRGETAMFSLPLFEWVKNQSSSMRLLFGMSAGSDEQGTLTNAGENTMRLLWANGWWDMNAAQSADRMLDAIHCVDLKTRRVDPALKQQIDDKLDKARESLTRIAPWNIMYLIAVGPLTNAVEKFSQGQVQLDEDRIVCGLERYRLAHGSYPPKLDALAPAYIDELPNDIMNGEPYHYRLNADGTFLLYSVGWDQVDEGGTVGYRANDPKAINYELGDWVWPMNKK